MRFQVFLFILSFSLLAGCLAEEQKATPAASLSTTGETWFAGIQSVQNLGGSPASVKLSWNTPLQTVSGFRIYSIIQDGNKSSWQLVDQVGPTFNSYVHSGLISGNLYTYKVEALDVSSNEDGNAKSLATVAFEGIADVIVTGPSTAQVRINSSYGSFDEIRVYAKPKSGGAKKLLGKILGSAVSLDVSGLHSGTTYQFSTEAYMAFLGSEDGNQAYVEKQLPSESFATGDPTELVSDYAYRGFMSIQAYGSAPHAPDDNLQPGRSPKTQLVRLTWLAFQNATTATRYRLFRVKAGGTFDFSTTANCSPMTDTTCAVCDRQGSIPQTCEDEQLPNFDPLTTKKQFMYAVSLLKNDTSTGDEWVEELPQQNANDFQVSVHLPPQNMVLVQRDAVNFEMCQVMGRQSDPRKHQRCPYTGLGAVPTNSGPNKPNLNLNNTFYDFGYNLFVDRYLSACNWTKASDGGMCGDSSTAGHPTPGDCIAAGAGAAPSPFDDSNFANKGKIGDVFFFLGQWGGSSPVSCWVKTVSGWVGTNSSSLTVNDWKHAITNDPYDSFRSPFTEARPDQMTNACMASTNAYGQKRLLRRREQVASMGLPWMTGEPFALSSYSRGRIISGSDGVGSDFRQCSARTSVDDLVTTPYPSAATVTDLVAAFLSSLSFRITGLVGSTYFNPGPSSNQFSIGNPWTVACTSRFGIALNGSSWIPTSDQVVRQSDTSGGMADFLGVTSAFDNGNSDLAGFHFNGIRGWSLPSSLLVGTDRGVSITNWNNAASNYGVPFPYYIVPLSLPLISKSSPIEDVMNTGDLVSTGTTDNQGINITQYISVNGGGQLGMSGSSFRWGLNLMNPGNWSAIRCGQEAE